MTVSPIRPTQPVQVSPISVKDSIVIGGQVRTMLSPREVGVLWALPVKTIYRLIHEGRLAVLNLSPGVGAGGKGDRYRIAYSTVRALEASRDAPIPAQ